MIYCVISGVATAGKEEAAAKWAVKVAKYFNQAYGKYGHMEIAQNLDGKSMTHWVERLNSLTALDEAKAKWATDKAVPPLDKEGAGLFGQIETHYYETVEG